MKIHKFNDLYDEVTEAYRLLDVSTQRIKVLEQILQNVVYASDQPMIEYITEAMKQNEPNKLNWS